ncbi:hypothetical protein, partial [Anaerocolumna sp.]|uniref:hypothetical protein n=1 Tax=Anaerocolumna sp. TaxID=2041569 RepID=UPI0028AA6D42
MVDFREYANRIKEMYQIEKETFYDDLMCFLVDNEWFHIKPLWQNGQLLVEPDDFQPYLPAIQQYFTSDEMSIADKSSELMTLLREKQPDTADKLK